MSASTGPSSSDHGPSPARGDRLEYELASDPANLGPTRRGVEAFCVARGLPVPAAEAVGLVLNEVLANVYRHAYANQPGRPVRVTVEDLGDAVRLVVRDWGSGINPAALPPCDRDPLTPGGLGMVCLRKLMDTAEFVPQPDGMMVVMTKRKRQ